MCHNFEEASDVADRVAIMNEGSIVQIGTLKNIIESPKNEFVARFVKSQNIFRGTSDGQRIKIGSISIEKKNPIKGDATIVIRPENITIHKSSNNGGENTFYGIVKYIKPKPYFTEIVVDIGLPIIIYSMDNKNLSKDDEIIVKIPSEKVVVINR